VKVLFLVRSLELGGAERQLVVLALGLRLEGHAVEVAVFYGGGALEAELREAGVPVHDLGKRGRWDNLRFGWRMARLVRRVRPDVLHGYLGGANIAAVAMRWMYPRVRVVWRIAASYVDLARFDRAARWTYGMEARLARLADLVIVNSQAGRRYCLQRGFPAAKLAVVPNGIDTEHFRREAAAGARLRAEWGAVDGGSLVGIVARLDPMKDHPTFLRAASEVARRRPEVRFVCVGDGPADYAARLRRLAGELGLEPVLTWAGARRDVVDVYSALDVLCSSSYGEGFPNVIGEAMSCGLPCVATDVGDCAWIIGDAGVVVAPKNVPALSEGLLQVLQLDDGERRALGDRARGRIAGHFDRAALIAQSAAALLSTRRRHAAPGQEPGR
jgi:glycosyltransferase involved in cell wall biosynthesis